MPEPFEPSDEKLLVNVAGAAQSAAQRALEMLYDRHATAVLRLAARLGLDATAAEDVLQDVFVVVATHACEFRGGSARGWLLAIAANRARELGRQRRRRGARERLGHQAPPAASPNDEAERRDEVEMLLAGLPGPRRLALELRLGQGLHFAEIAHVLGVSLRTAKNWVADSLARLRADQQEHHG